MRNKKKLSLMLSFVMVLSCFSFGVMAQGNDDVDVPVGDTIESDMVTLLDEPHATDGGLVSAIESTVRKWIKYLGVEVYLEETITQEQDFTLISFDANSAPDFENIIDDGVYKVSEDVEIRGVQGVWSTNSITSFVEEADTQVLSAIGGEYMFYDNGDALQAQEHVGGDIYKFRDGGGTSIDASVTLCAGETFCPTEAEILAEYGGASAIISWALDQHYGHYAYAIQFDGALEGEALFIIDKDLSETIVFGSSELSGFMTDAITGQVLQIRPAGLTDVYGIIPV